jgi:hypothetical protein
MARIGITYEDVQRAIDTLLQRQEAPSVQKVREVLGTGSFTTISEHLREWRARREQRKDLPPSRGMPEPLQKLAEGLWEQAQEAANEGLVHYRQEADGRVDAAQKAAAKAARRAEDAEQRESALSAHLARLDERLSEQTAELAHCQAERDTALKTSEQQQAAVERLESQINKAQQQLNDREASYQQHRRDQEDEWKALLAQEEKRHESAEARLMSLLDEARQEYRLAEKTQHAQQAKLEQKLAKAQDELKVQQQEQQALSQELSQARAEGERERLYAEQRDQAAQAEINRLKKIESEQGQELGALGKALEQRDAQIAVLESKLQDRLWSSLERVLSDAEQQKEQLEKK